MPELKIKAHISLEIMDLLSEPRLSIGSRVAVARGPSPFLAPSHASEHSPTESDGAVFDHDVFVPARCALMKSRVAVAANQPLTLCPSAAVHGAVLDSESVRTSTDRILPPRARARANSETAMPDLRSRVPDLISEDFALGWLKLRPTDATATRPRPLNSKHLYIDY